jgi:putative Mn2+ efflux pump MntP
MDTVSVFAVAFALAMDAFAVSIAAGVALQKITLRHTARLAWHFGFFQFAMPVIGWSAGSAVRFFFETYNHWIAFVLLLLVGGNMIREAFQNQGEKPQDKDPTRGLSLVLLSVATSIDALAVGLSFSVLGESIWFPAVIIGIVAALFTGAGIHIGNRLGEATRLGRCADISGGLVLIAIGFTILYKNGVFERLL